MKTYIAVILTFIFLAKFVAVDANGLNALFSGSDVSFVNPHCKKQNSIKKVEETAHFSKQDHIATQMITLVGQCISPFRFELFSWDLEPSEPITVFNEHITSRLSHRYLESISPPPRLS